MVSELLMHITEKQTVRVQYLLGFFGLFLVFIFCFCLETAGGFCVLFGTIKFEMPIIYLSRYVEQGFWISREMSGIELKFQESA